MSNLIGSHVTQKHYFFGENLGVINDDDDGYHRLQGCNSFYSTLTYQIMSSETTLYCVIFYSLL